MPSEDDLIRASQRGDTEASEILFQRYHRPLFHAALRVTRNVQDAEDALQDGLLSAYRNLGRFEGRSQFSTWLTRIVINAARMKRRSIRTRRWISLDSFLHEEGPPTSEWCVHPGASPEQLCWSGEIRGRIDRRLISLSPRIRSAFILREIAGHSTDEAARKLNISGNALKARVWRARRHIRKAFA